MLFAQANCTSAENRRENWCFNQASVILLLDEASFP